MAETKRYEVAITVPAQERYQAEVLTYLLAHFSLERAAEIDQRIFSVISSLTSMPARGRIVDQLTGYPQEFRYLLYQETRYFTLKIIYYLDEAVQKVYVTDFFPLQMNPDQLFDRSS